MRHEVAIIGDKDHRLSVARRVGHRDLEETRHGAIENAEAVLAALDFEERLVNQVDGHRVTKEAVEIENVEVELSVLVPCLVGQHEIEVVVEIAPGLVGAAGQAQVNAVVNRFVAPIQPAIDVEHPRDALIDILRGETEHVIVEPMRAHGLVPVAGDLVQAAIIRGAGCHGIAGVGVDRFQSRQHDRIVVVVKLAGEEIGASEAVVFCAVMAIVLMRGDRVPPETSISVLIGCSETWAVAKLPRN
jgi:hypothetical protein